MKQRYHSCGCLWEIHPSQTHAEHMVELERDKAREIAARAVELSRGTFADQMMAIALVHRGAELELSRLGRKACYR